MKTTQWLVAGLPLCILGASLIFTGVTISEASNLMYAAIIVGCIYLAIGVLLFRGRVAIKRIAIYIWFPLLLLIPIGTSLAIFAIRILTADPVGQEARREHIRSLAFVDVEKLVEVEALRSLDVEATQFRLSLERDLDVSPMLISDFLEDLAGEGLPVYDDDRVDIESINDLLTILRPRCENVAE